MPSEKPLLEPSTPTRAQAMLLLTKVPRVKLTITNGKTLKVPVTQFMTLLFGKPRRAGDLKPGVMISVLAELHGSHGLASYWSEVTKVEWDKAPDREIADHRVAAGDVACPICGCKFFDHPMDRRYPGWPDGVPYLNVICTGDVVKL